MSTKLIARLFVTITFALIFGFLGSVVSADSDEIFVQPKVGECTACHWVVRDSWEANVHGEAGVGCETCHSPVNQNHPNEVMPTDISSRLCGSCHGSTDEEFEASIHGQEDLTCIRCHNSHTTNIKSDTVQGLCEDCHADRTHYYSLSTHSDNNVLCTDCHLPLADSESRIGPGNKVHTFEPNLKSCETCHNQDLHPLPEEVCNEEAIAAAEAQGDESICPSEEIVAAGFKLPEDQNLMIEPGDTSPVGFAMIGTLVGMAAGMILSPWLEKWFERFQR